MLRKVKPLSRVSMPHAAIPFRPHHRFAVPLPRSRRGGLVTRRFLAESRNISFPRRCGGSGERSEPMGALMPHAALWVVQQSVLSLCRERRCRFNAARGFVGGAAPFRICSSFRDCVSMPHAALWVVQLYMLFALSDLMIGFNAARGFVGGAASASMIFHAKIRVSMPHAALWVVQPRRSQLFSP